MSVEPQAPPAAPAPAARAANAWLPLAAWVFGTAALFGALLLLAGELAAARVPQHRAALEQLIRRQTGLDVSFSELSVRWGWYGPEAVFHAVVLGEPGGRGARLRAPQLIVGLDIWRLLRSAELEASRITLVSADIDLGGGGTAPPATAAAAAATPLEHTGTRLLARWRGGRIDLEGGTLHWLEPGETLPLTLSVRHAQLRRQDGAWNADAWVLLPARLGSSARLTLQLREHPMSALPPSGTASFEGRMLEFSGWRSLAAARGLARYLPEAGRGSLELRTQFAGGRLVRADGRLDAQGLEWRAPLADAAPLHLERVRGTWQLSRSAGRWQLAAEARDLAPAAPPLSLAASGTDDGSRAAGEVRDLPLALLAAAVRAVTPALPAAQPLFGGMAREASFDFDAHREAGQRLLTRARLEDLVIASPSGEVLLRGLSAALAGEERTLRADLTGADAELTVLREQPLFLDHLSLKARLRLGADAQGWQLACEACELTRGATRLAAAGTLAATQAAAGPRIRAHATLQDADAALVAALAAPQTRAALGGAGVRLTDGRISHAELEWRGPLTAGEAPWAADGSEFRGALELSEATLAGEEPWPQASGLSARVEFRGSRWRAEIAAASLAGFTVQAARADWDAAGLQPTHLSALLRGRVEQARAWLRAHPQFASLAPGVADVELSGDAAIDVALRLPGALAPAGGAHAKSRIAARLDGVQLRAIAGLPPLERLRGTLAFNAGHLEPSTLTGAWLEGPVTLDVAERRESGAVALAISGHGSVAARAALRAAGADQAGTLAGAAEWSALLSFLPGSAAASPRWRLRADSNLQGVASDLPEPFAKSAGVALPLHVEVQAEADDGLLRVSLGERLRALAALTREGELWRLTRGTVRLAALAPALPAEPVLRLEGRVGRLDLPAYLALWRQAGADAALPELRARLSAAQLLIGTRSFADAELAATAAASGGTLELSATGLSGSARWPAPDSATPASVTLTQLDVEALGDAVLGPGLLAALAPEIQLSIAALRWQGRALGSFSATLDARPGGFAVRGFYLSSAQHDIHGNAGCAGGCRLEFSLESHDAAATLAAFGFRPEVSAAGASLEGELSWPSGAASLASLDGRLHMQLEQGRTHAPAGAGAPFALLAVPALAAGMAAREGAAEVPELAFARLTGDYTLKGGQALLRDLHFDGDAEILVRGRAGLAARDYDAQAWILRGEERLPAPLRRFGAAPKVAALWLSLRELFGGAQSEHQRALRLSGSWDEPVVTGSE